jgi:xanthine dehydrogenase accessory factor
MQLMNKNTHVVLIRGGGDLASGVALRLHRVGFHVLITELPYPLVVRRLASFAQATFDGSCQVEEVTGKLVDSPKKALQVMEEGQIAVMIDPFLESRQSLNLLGVVDGRMIKKAPDLGMDVSSIVIGLGPGFIAGENCHAVIETNRGPYLGRVYWHGTAEPDTGLPDIVKGFREERVFYAPKNGILHAFTKIGDIVEEGTLVAKVDDEPVFARFRGVLRGLIQDGLFVKYHMKIGDLDPRCDIKLCTLASDKAMAIGGGVLEALLVMDQRNRK